MDKHKFYIEAPITINKETAILKEKASKVIELPAENEKQPDLMYFSAILVSSGENLNHAYFLGSELVAAEGTIVNKALDVEHAEQEIIGHLIERVYITKDGETLDITELSSKEVASLDAQDMHIAIAGIIYKNRFPNLAEEVASNKFKVSMECYYVDHDIKIGNLILNKNEAEALGLASKDDKILGRMAKVIKEGKEIAKGEIARVLRGICFSGCGIVKNPANPASVILETAKEKSIKQDDTIIILDYDNLQASKDGNNVTLDKVSSSVNTEESRNGNLDDTVGICVNYKRRVEDKDGNILNNDWCTAYESGCTAFGSDATDPNCLRNQEVNRFTKAAFSKRAKLSAESDRRKELLDGLKAALREADKTKSR